MRGFQFSILAVLWAVVWLPPSRAEVQVTGKVTDETGAAVAGANVQLLPAVGKAVAVSSDATGNFTAVLAAPGDYTIRAQRQGFFVFNGKPEHFSDGANSLSVTLNHLRELAESIDVAYSPPAIDL